MRHLSRRFLLAALASAIVISTGSTASAADDASPVPGKRVALRGFDPVAYFTDGGPQKGTSEFWFAFDDAVYLFRSAEHRALFASDPERYAPQYHGYCTIKVSEGERAEPDPEAWAVLSGKLYVFRSKRGLARFSQNPDEFVTKANAAWETLRASQ